MWVPCRHQGRQLKTSVQQILTYLNENEAQVLTAWTLHKNIEIHDIFDTHVMTLSGEPPWLPSDSSFALSPLSTIRIAYRQHQKYWSYDQNFRLINRHDGHYWAIIPCGNQPDREETAARVSTSNYYSPGPTIGQRRPNYMIEFIFSSILPLFSM